MKVAAVQYRPPKGDPPAARAALAALVDEAGRQGAGLIVCPEMATSGYVWSSPDEVGPHCEAARGPTLAALGPVAARHGAMVVCGFPERGDDGLLYNSALVIGPDGSLMCCYRKTTLYDADLPWARPGDRTHLVRAPFGLVMPAICMDLNHDRVPSTLHARRVDLLAFCTNWVDEGEDVWPYWRLRLWGWRGVFIAANTWGEDRGTRFSGRSVVMVDGVALASAEREGDAVVVAEVEGRRSPGA